MEESKLFHESWYRIAGQRICLRASIKVKRQLYRGSRWYVLHDPFNNQFYRIRPSAYKFIARLSLNRTVEEVWKEIISEDPDDAPGQEDVIHLLAQLYHANLLHYSLPADSAKLFERFKKQKQKIVQATLMNIMFFRIPLFDPDNLLKRLLPILRLIISPIGMIIWLVVVAMGVKVAIDNFAELGIQSQGILAPSNIPLLYLSFIFIKAFHEFGHAFVVRRYGGEVHTMGIMFLIFNPIPYMDATAAWSFRNKWKRVFVGAAGMIFELFIAAIAALMWAYTGPGLIHSLTYNIIFVASVSTILFNINPLLRFDGYYILSDLLDIPNLHTQATQHLRHIVERYVFGYKKSKSPVSSFKEAVLITIFGILSGIYRIVVFTTILLFVADRFLLLGIIMVVVCAISWVLIPLIRFIRYLLTEPRLERTRIRAILVSLGAALAVFLLLYVIPFPHTFTSPGVIEADEYMRVTNKVGGYVYNIVVPSGIWVTRGQTLILLQNKELDFKIKEMAAKIDEISIMAQKALHESLADVKPINSLLAAITKRYKRLKEEKKDLEVKADIDGIWIAPYIDDYKGMWIHRGTPIGQLINNSGFYFSSVISQQVVSRFFSDEIRSASIKLIGESEKDIHISKYTIIPVEQTSLPSAALGFAAGGELTVDVTDKSGIKTTEPFYEVRLEIPDESLDGLHHGRTGRVQCKVPMEPLLHQWWIKLIQLIQKRYQL
jgi:putative peptide zinc metalloprotease protein